MPVDSARLEEVFGEAAVMTEAAARSAYLDEACRDNAELRRRVEALLAAHDAADRFLKLPEADGAAIPFVPLSERPGATVGRYKLLEQIGEGGFGVVFMAEQEHPVRRRVALKIIKAGMDTRQVVARFEAERQALAMMDHPNIAKVLDAGATDTGRPYFVMELIRGIPITKYCDAEELSIADRLALIIQVCQAVQHAHQKGIIHRDLKPSNVLVAMHDERPMPKIIDFGVAKAIEGKLTERTLFTGFHQFIGTPTYMSPEQAQLSGLDVDTRSDIYSLGVLLYELLTGTTPFDSKQLLAAGFGELQRIVRDVDPPSPSTRISTLAADHRRTKANERKNDPQRLAQALRGDLDWIVMRCLEKDRARRYATANSLALDVQRYLNDEPIEARPPTSAYRLRKFIRRNKAGVFAGAAISTALACGLGLSTWLYLRERDARHEAVAASAQAAQLVLKSLAHNHLLEAGFLARNRDIAASEQQIASATKVLEQLLPEHAAGVHHELGGLRAQRGQWSDAAFQYLKAIDLNPADFEHYYWAFPALIRSNDLSGYHQLRQHVFRRFGQTHNAVVAERLIKGCLILRWPGANFDMLNKLAAVLAEADPSHWAWSYFQFARGLLEYRQGHFDESKQYLKRTLERENDDPNRNVQAYMVLAMAHFQLQQPQEAEAILAKGLEFSTQTLPSESNLIGYGGWYDWVVAHALTDEATMLIRGSQDQNVRPQ